MAPQLSKQEWQALRLKQEVAQKRIAATPNVRSYVRQHAPRPRGVAFDHPSTCFVSLFYSARDRGVYATFVKGGSYFFPVSKADAADWAADPSYGQFFNANVRE